MEVKSRKLIQSVSLEGTDFKGEVEITDGSIDHLCMYILSDKQQLYVKVKEKTIRDLHKELTSLLSLVDSQKGVGSV